MMFIPVGLGPQEDLNLWWMVFEPAQGWNTDERFPGHHSGANPALAGATVVPLPTRARPTLRPQG